MKVTVEYDSNTSGSFSICSGVKQGCILAPTLFRIFFSVLLRHAFGAPISTLGQIASCPTWPTSGQEPKYARPSSGTCSLLMITTHTVQQLKCLIDYFSQACKDFGLTISLKKKTLMYLDRMWKLNPSSQLTTMSWKLPISSHVLDP